MTEREPIMIAVEGNVRGSYHPESPDINPLIDALRSRMITMTEEERLNVRRSIMEGYCEQCGSKHLPCYCTRDD